ncbi:MAG: patatin-like phospholipase family protein [Rhodospirillaceae bacterium]|nr:patatin-like phospholipase family protein [Rhodospirillales bacterium]
MVSAPHGFPYQVVLVLQGGGALGSYQVGVYQALEEAGYFPDWVAGTSIGAVNAALIAGNEPGARLEKLDTFWSSIRWPELLPAMPSGPMRQWANWSAAMRAAAFGQPNFFRPRIGSSWLGGGAPGWYDVQPLRTTLERLVNFGRINAGGTRLSVGAVNLCTGEQVFFDSAREPLQSCHILASAALPPAFPPVEIAGAWYWDGGVVSNTPLDVVIDDNPRRSSLVFMVDLFEGRGAVPTSMADVEQRRNDIAYATRSGRSIEKHRLMHNLRRAVNALWQHLPAELRNDPHLQEMAALRCTTTMQIVHIQYRREEGEAAYKGYDFSAPSLLERRRAGYRDTSELLRRPAWLAAPPEDLGVLIYEPPGAEDEAERLRRTAVHDGSRQ